jgi:hypothetical protein
MAWEKWAKAFIKASEQCAPVREFQIKSNQQKWITPEIVKEMNLRDHLHTKSCGKRDTSLWDEYKKSRNKVNKMIKNAKKGHYQTLINENKQKPKRFCREMTKLMPNKINMNSIPKSITADKLNAYFSCIGKKTSEASSNTPTVGTTCPLWKGPKSIYKFKMNQIHNSDVLKHLQNVRDKPNLDILGIDAKLLKVIATDIVLQLMHLLNLSVQNGYVPLDWKLAIYKGKGDQNEEGNYRPISVVSHIGKLMEKQVHSQFIVYLESHDFISKDQSAYLKGHSTTTCLHKVVDDWLEAMNEGQVISVCFLDIQKCFDTINHEILLAKLSYYGIEGNEMQWFKSYLTDRRQQVICNGVLSNTSTVDIGVPQGSILSLSAFCE